MNYNHPVKNNSTVGIHLMCAIVFLTFSFVYLYFFQADVIAVVQHVLSYGVTHYNRLVGAVLITLTLYLVQLLIYVIVRLRKRSHALTYFPSMLALGIVSDVNYDVNQNFSLGAWWWLLPLLLVLWAGIAFLARALQEIEPDTETTGLFSRPMWINMLIMSFFIILVASFSNTNAVFHFRMRAESLMLEGKFDKALEVGSESLESDADLQMIRMYALSRVGELPERLFAYPIVAHSSAILPVEGQSQFLMYPVDSLYKFLGARPGIPMSTSRYLQLMQMRSDSISDKRIADYQLCGLLIDKRIDDFVIALRHLYAEGDSLDIDRLPLHYREAMTLYTHLRSNPQIVYHHTVMDEDWDNMLELEREYTNKTERKIRVGKQYSNTYWFYYKYE